MFDFKTLEIVFIGVVIVGVVGLGLVLRWLLNPKGPS